MIAGVGVGVSIGERWLLAYLGCPLMLGKLPN